MTIYLRSDCLVCVCLTFAVCTFSLVCHNAEQFIVACLLENGLKYGDKPGGFLSKVPGVSVLALDLEGVHDLKLHHPSSSVATSNQ